MPWMSGGAKRGVLGFGALLLLMAPLATVAQDPTDVTHDSGLYIVFFQEPALASYEGGIAGLAATAPRAKGQKKLDAKSPESVAYLDFLKARHIEYVDAIEQSIGRNLEVRYNYLAAGNGIAAAMDAEEASRVAQLPGVVSVTKDVAQPLDTDAGPALINAPAVWDGTGTGGQGPATGEGVIVASLDSGANMDHISYSDAAPDGHTYVNPFGAGTYVGWCDPTNPNFSASYPCNEKLIGAWDYADASWTGTANEESDGPEDNNGHGTHTGTTAAGNRQSSPAISGVAPHANVIAYDVCNAAAQASCFTSDSIAATNQAIMDGVDVINFSIGGGGNPWGDADRTFLDAVNAGIFVAASAGNSGPTAGSTGHQGPWVMTVGMSTHDRVDWNNQANSFSASGAGPVPATINGSSRTTEVHGPALIVYAGNFANGDPDPEQCLNPFPANTWTNDEIVVCDRGAIARVKKCENVALGGAGGCVLANVSGGATTVVADAHVIPSIHVNQTSGDSLKAWLASGTNHMATLTAASMTSNPAQADAMSAGSSRGPANFDVIKPDVTAPGVSIFAGHTDANSDGFLGSPYSILSGTSMSSPHVAGAAALLTELHPTWSPPQIKSALMLTSTTAVTDGGQPATPFAMGAGRIDVADASRSGLVLDETFANFLAANPAGGGNPATLNLASMQSGNCVGTCSFTRTLSRTTLGAGASYTYSVQPPAGMGYGVLELSDDGTDITLLITVDVEQSGLPFAFNFGTITMTPSNGALPDLHMPIAARPNGEAMIFEELFEGGNLDPWGSTNPP